MSPRPTRALLATLDLPPTIGGVQTLARELIVRARRTSFHVVAPAEPGAAEADAALPARVVRVPRLVPGRWGFIPSVALATRRLARRPAPDVVLSMHALAGVAVPRAVPMVVVVYGGELRSPRIRAVARRVLPRARRVVAISRFTARAAQDLGAAPDAIEVIPVGAPEPEAVDAARVAAFRERIGGAKIVLSVSRLVEHKGHDRLVGALARLPAEVHVAIVGEGADRTRLTALARDRGVAERLHLLGSLTGEQLATAYASADAFALLSRATHGGVEGGGIAILEACAYGLPVVAGASGGIPEAITDGETGLLVDPLDEGAAAAALGRVLEDRVLAVALGERAAKMAAGERSWDAIVERYESLLAEVARAR
ncbi:MAG TPA: glycosyltransferase [Actinomycetota bacterium]